MKRFYKNPILGPIGDSWQKEACFNPNVIKGSSKYVMVYRAMSGKMDHHDANLNLSTIGRAESQDGLDFINRQQLIKPELEWEKYGCEDPRICKMGNDYYIFYTALSTHPPRAEGIRLAVAISSDLKTIKEKHLVTPFNSKTRNSPCLKDIPRQVQTSLPTKKKRENF